jgi:hypothetical protein
LLNATERCRRAHGLPTAHHMSSVRIQTLVPRRLAREGVRIAQANDTDPARVAADSDKTRR